MKHILTDQELSKLEDKIEDLEKLKGGYIYYQIYSRNYDGFNRYTTTTIKYMNKDEAIENINKDIKIMQDMLYVSESKINSSYNKIDSLELEIGVLKRELKKKKGFFKRLFE